MKKLLIVLLFSIITPVSNEQILKNMGELFKSTTLEQPYYYTLEITIQKEPRKAIESKTIEATAKDGTKFIVSYTEVSIFGYSIMYRVRNDAGLGLNSIYLSEDELRAAVWAAVEEYNRTVPVGSPICLLPFGLLYLLTRKKKWHF